MQDGTDSLGPDKRIGDLEVIKTESGLIAKADNEDTLVMLGNKAPSIDDAVRDLIAQAHPAGSADHPEDVAPVVVVVDQVLYIFQHKDTEPVISDDPGYIEEQGALCLAADPMSQALGILLADPGNREGLTGEPGQQQAMRRDVFGVVSALVMSLAMM